MLYEVNVTFSGTYGASCIILLDGKEINRIELTVDFDVKDGIHLWLNSKIEPELTNGFRFGIEVKKAIIAKLEKNKKNKKVKKDEWNRYK